MSDLTSPFIRPQGKPKIEKNPFNGFRKITRLFAVDPEAATEPNIEDQVFLEYGTPDQEYPEALLTAQQLNPSEDVDRASLTRIYMELPPEGVKVETEAPDIQILEGRRYIVTRKFIALTGYVDKYDQDVLKDIDLQDIYEMPYVAPPDPAFTLGTNVAIYEVEEGTGDLKIKTFLGSRDINNYPIHCEMTEMYHSHDNVTSESSSLTKFGVATTVSVINPSHIPQVSFDISLSFQKFFIVVNYKTFPEQFKLLSEKEGYRADGSRTLTRTYSAPKQASHVYNGSRTPEDYIPSAILNDMPILVFMDAFPDWTEGLGLPTFETLYAGFYWIMSAVSVDVSNPRMDVWTINYITAGMPFWIKNDQYFSRPGIVNLQADDVIYEAGPQKVLMNTTTYVWYEMPAGGTTSSHVTNFTFPTVALSGAVTYSEGDTQNFDKIHNNYLRKGRNRVTFEAQEVVGDAVVPAVGGSGPNGDGPIKAKKFKGRAVTTSGHLTCAGDEYDTWEIRNKVLKVVYQPVFNKGGNSIWKVSKTVVNSSTRDLYDD